MGVYPKGKLLDSGFEIHQTIIDKNLGAEKRAGRLGDCPDSHLQ